MRSKKKKKPAEKGDYDEEDNIPFPSLEFLEENPDFFVSSKPYVKTYQFEESDNSTTVISVKHPQKLTNPIPKEQIPTLPNNFVTTEEICQSLMGMFFYNARLGVIYENNCVMTKKIPFLAALETFVLAFKCGVYPPLNILEYFAFHFGIYLKNEGKMSLDEAFGIKKKGVKGTIFCTEKKHRRDIILTNEMGKLMHFFGVNLDEAATMISAALMGEKGKPSYCQI